MRSTIFFTLVLCIIYFSPALAQNSQPKPQLFVGSQGKSSCCGGSGNALYNGSNGVSTSTAGPLNIKNLIQAKPKPAGYKKVMRRDIKTFDFGQGYDSDKKAKTLNDLALQTEVMEYENAVQRAQERQAKLRKTQDQMQKNLAYYKQQSEMYNQKIEKQNNPQGHTPQQTKVSYINSSSKSQKSNGPQRLFLSDR